MGVPLASARAKPATLVHAIGVFQASKEKLPKPL
jgi:hypothetical protein